MIRLVIFDFDGTIVDSKRVYYNSITRHLLPRGIKGSEINRVIALGMNLSGTLKKFVPRFVTRWFLKKSIMRDVTKRINDVKKCHDVSLIKDIHKRRILVSNSLAEFVYPVLRHLKIEKYFSEVHCTDEFADKGKFIRTYLKIHGIRPYEAVYIGDRAKDAELARKLGLHSIIISGKCAWDSREDILKAKPEFIVPDLKFAKTIIERMKE